MANLVNLTPHDVHIHLANGQVIMYPRSGHVARLTSVQRDLGQLDNGIPLVSTQQFTGIEGIPPEHNNSTNLIVSCLVAEYLISRGQTSYCPDTSPEGVVRDDQGRILGTKRLVKF